MSENAKEKKRQKMDLKVGYKDIDVKHADVITQRTHRMATHDRGKKRGTKILFRRYRL